MSTVLSRKTDRIMDGTRLSIRAGKLMCLLIS